MLSGTRRRRKDVRGRAGLLRNAISPISPPMSELLARHEPPGAARSAAAHDEDDGCDYTPTTTRRPGFDRRVTAARSGVRCMCAVSYNPIAYTSLKLRLARATTRPSRPPPIHVASRAAARREPTRARRLRPRAATPRGRLRRPALGGALASAARRARRGHSGRRRQPPPRAATRSVWSASSRARGRFGSRQLQARPHRPLSDETTSSGESGRNAHACTRCRRRLCRVRSARTPMW